MKILKWVVILIGLFFVAGFFMPGTTHVERSLTINAPASTLFNQITELKNWGNWSPWHKLDPNTVWKYSEPSSAGIGAFYTWASDNKNVGNGKLTILDEKANEFVKCKMSFEGMGDATTEFKFATKDSITTHLTWTLDSDNGLNPLSRWMGLMMDKFVGPDYEKGLANLKAFSETK